MIAQYTDPSPSPAPEQPPTLVCFTVAFCDIPEGWKPRNLLDSPPTPWPMTTAFLFSGHAPMGIAESNRNLYKAGILDGWCAVFAHSNATFQLNMCLHELPVGAQLYFPVLGELVTADHPAAADVDVTLPSVEAN